MRIALENENRRAGLFALANEAAIGADGWVRLATYGDHPLAREVIGKDGVAHVEQYIQRFTKAGSVAMANSHNSFFGKLRNLRRGAPIKRGHTDRWEVAEVEGITLAAKKPAALENSNLGMFAKLEAREDALYGLPIFDDAAQAVIERERLRYFSPYWWTDVVALENGVMIAEPIELISVALTDSPNLKDSPALANEKDKHTNQANCMKKKIMELLRKFKIALANEDDSTIEAALPQLEAIADAKVALENEKTTLTTNVTTLTGERDTAKTALANEQTAHGTTRTALENANAEANELTISLAIAEGRVAASERTTRLETLKTGGATARKALLNETVKFKVTAVTTAARRDGNKVNAQAGAGEKLVALCNEAVRKGEAKDFDEAWQRSKTINADLHEAMKEKADE